MLKKCPRCGKYNGTASTEAHGTEHFECDCEPPEDECEDDDRKGEDDDDDD